MLNKLNENQFKSLIKNKRIAIVCPSKCVARSKQRNLIESYDLVVRVNRQHPVPHHLIDDIGSKTDLLYNSNLGDPGDNLIENLEDGWLDDIQCVLYPEDSKMTKHFEEKASKYKKTITTFPWQCLLTYQMLKQARSWGIKCPNQKHDFFVGHTGTIALYHLCLNDPSEIYVTGMTFYREPYYNGYREKNHIPMEEEKKQLWDKWKNNEIPRKIHNIDMDAEVKFFKKLKKECNIKNDETMQTILDTP